MQPENRGDYWQSQNGVAPVASDHSTPPSPDTPVASSAPEGDATVLSWEASEYVHHEKRTIWFVWVLLAALILLGISIFLLQSITFSVLVIVMTIALLVYAVRPPHIMRYQLSHYGIRINDKTFRFHDFRYFGVIEEGPLISAVMIPVKRFLPAVNLYFPTEQADEIVDILGSNLPMEDVEPDAVEKMMHKLRF